MEDTETYLVKGFQISAKEILCNIDGIIGVTFVGLGHLSLYDVNSMCRSNFTRLPIGPMM